MIYEMRGGMSEVGCEIFSSHSIFKADLEVHGSATQQQVIHTLMHSITLEIEACMLACQTLARGEGSYVTTAL